MSRTVAFCTLFIALTLVIACGKDAVAPEPGELSLTIACEPDLDTLQVWDSLTLTVVEAAGRIPRAVRWSIYGRGDEVVGDTFTYRPDTVGMEAVRAVAEFAGGDEAAAERTFVTRENRPPEVWIEPTTFDSLVRMPIGDTARLVAHVFDPDGDGLGPGDVEWLRELPDTALLLGRGYTLAFFPDSLKRYRLAARVTDPGGLHSIARYVVESYDPITPAVWRRHIKGGRYGREMALIPGGNLVVTTYEQLVTVTLDGRKRGSIVADRPDIPVVGPGGDIYYVEAGRLVSLSGLGEENWDLESDAEGRTPFSSPSILSDGSMVVPMAGCNAPCFRRVTAAGTVQWTAGLDTTEQLANHAVGKDGTVYAAAADRSDPYFVDIYALDKNGSVRWRTQERQRRVDVTSMVVADDSTLLVCADSLYAFSTEDGAVRWVTEGYVGSLSVGAGGIAYHAWGYHLAHILVARDISDGSERWRVELPRGEIFGDDFRSYPILTANGQLVVSQESEFHDPTVVGYDVTNGQVLWRHRLAGYSVGAPLLTESGLFLIFDRYGYLEAIDVGAGPADSPWPMYRATAQRTNRMRSP